MMEKIGFFFGSIVGKLGAVVTQDTAIVKAKLGRHELTEEEAAKIAKLKKMKEALHAEASLQNDGGEFQVGVVPEEIGEVDLLTIKVSGNAGMMHWLRSQPNFFAFIIHEADRTELKEALSHA